MAPNNTKGAIASKIKKLHLVLHADPLPTATEGKGLVTCLYMTRPVSSGFLGNNTCVCVAYGVSVICGKPHVMIGTWHATTVAISYCVC